jgi:hypothetical protein
LLKFDYGMRHHARKIDIIEQLNITQFLEELESNGDKNLIFLMRINLYAQHTQHVQHLSESSSNLAECSSHLVESSSNLSKSNGHLAVINRKTNSHLAEN